MKRTSRALSAGFAALTIAGSLMLTGCHKSADSGGAGSAGSEKGRSGGPTSTPVQVTPVKLGTIATTVPVTGSLAALEDVQLSAKTTGRVLTVTVREGDVVHAGQLIVQQDATDLQANVNQAQAGVTTAQSKVAQAVTNYQIQVTQARQAILQARAAVAAAQQNYLKLQRGNRPQQKLQAQAQTAQAKANLDNAQINLTRNQSLYQQGAIAKADLDTAQTTYNVDVQLYKNALASQSLVQAGYQQEDIAAAQEQVREQQTSLRNAIANEKQVELRKQDILAAQAGVAQAKATLAFNQQQVAYAYIRSPINGIVAARETEPGQVATTGTNLVRIVNVKTVYYEPTIDESAFAQTSVGNPVEVRSDALPGKVYLGKVVAIYPAATAGTRTFSLRVNIPNPLNELRPGMFARGSLLTEVHRNAVIIPVSALIAVQSQNGLAANTSSEGTATGSTTLPPQQVFLVGPNNRAMARPVTVGIVANSQAEITSGLRPGDRLITVGQGIVHPGDKVQVQQGPNGAQTASTDATG